MPKLNNASVTNKLQINFMCAKQRLADADDRQAALSLHLDVAPTPPYMLVPITQDTSFTSIRHREAACSEGLRISQPGPSILFHQFSHRSVEGRRYTAAADEGHPW